MALIQAGVGRKKYYYGFVDGTIPVTNLVGQRTTPSYRRWLRKHNLQDSDVLRVDTKSRNVIHETARKLNLNK